jgi:hypothetical protein
MAKNITARLDRSRATLAEINARLASLTDRRRERLLAGDNAAAIGKIDSEIEAQQRAAKTEADRVLLLEREAATEAVAAENRRREAATDAFAAKLREADAAGDELQAVLEKADELFRKIIRCREEARAGWPLASAHFNALAGATDGAALSAHAVHALVRHEIHRIGSRPFLGGSPGVVGEVSFPGGMPPNLTLQLKLSATHDVQRQRSGKKFGRWGLPHCPEPHATERCDLDYVAN